MKSSRHEHPIKKNVRQTLHLAFGRKRKTNILETLAKPLLVLAAGANIRCGNLKKTWKQNIWTRKKNVEEKNKTKTNTN